MLSKKTMDQVRCYNENTTDDDLMEVFVIGDDWYAMKIGGVEITTGDSLHVEHRVNQIFRENGLILMF